LKEFVAMYKHLLYLFVMCIETPCGFFKNFTTKKFKKKHYEICYIQSYSSHFSARFCTRSIVLSR